MADKQQLPHPRSSASPEAIGGNFHVVELEHGLHDLVVALVLTVSNGMDAPTFDGINVPEWKCQQPLEPEGASGFREVECIPRSSSLVGLRHLPEPEARSDLRLLGDVQCVFNLNAKVSHRALELGVSEEQLHRMHPGIPS